MSDLPDIAIEAGRSDRTSEIDAGAWLAAIVENSDDAILSKTLDGVITTWNRGASRLFGYSAEEAIGKPVTIVIPEDRLHEEEHILARLRAGERIDHFETVRRRKDGTLIEISLTVSPVRNAAGQILGASKIARDITAQKRAAAQQMLLLKEMRHRVKNLFALATGLVALSARGAHDVGELTSDLTARLMALAAAHQLTLPDLDNEGTTESSTTLFSLLEAIVAPHELADERKRIFVKGTDLPVGGGAFTSVALLLHELATNAAKYGALSTPDGRLDVTVSVQDDDAIIHWAECGGPRLDRTPDREGFGTALEQASLKGTGGTLVRSWKDAGLTMEIRFKLSRLAA
ncbi:PAS domain S-box protein [Sphingobium indicum]|uniref:histidine kinase n=2 Tax=Sphingobium indicum TaxID=332055 RepID=A0A1L5BNZ6_SPHIB|nr:PAS domain S-box protein [Sphingobium indicum]APL94586.1 histidine kinase [Sphingobium indicum B90A]KEY97636.1 histidine kinase [Sphingomonas sp. BHC-A]NYI23277.1 PAS domain S-box-containing protein [Sphingobium indicum]RYM04336.1 PAS domain S-box protein [Sphingobium indicum]